MPQSLKTILAVWFALQVTLPFTAPLKTWDLADLFGTRGQHDAQAPESSTTPLPASETAAKEQVCVSPLDVSALRVSTALAVVHQVALSGPFLAALDLSPSPSVHQTVLRV